MTKDGMFVLMAGAMVLTFANGPLEAGMPNLNMWFEAAPLNAQSLVVSQGKFGEDTVLGCDTSGGSADCQWRVIMVMDNSAAPDGTVTSAIAANFVGETFRHSIPAGDIAPGDYLMGGHALTPNPAAGVIAEYRRVWVPVANVNGNPTFVGVPTGVYSVLEFTLNSTVAPGDIDIDGIDIANNDLFTVFVTESGNPPPPVAIVQFGDAAAFSGQDVGGLAPDVIRFENVPEPSVALLLIFGASVANAGRARKRNVHVH